MDSEVQPQAQISAWTTNINLMHPQHFQPQQQLQLQAASEGSPQPEPPPIALRRPDEHRHQLI